MMDFYEARSTALELANYHRMARIEGAEATVARARAYFNFLTEGQKEPNVSVIHSNRSGGENEESKE